MAKNNQIKKVVNGEIADADDINQIVENAGSEGGSIPYDPTTHTRDDDGNEPLGSANYPWGDIFINEEAFLKEVVTGSASISFSVKFKHLRKLAYLKDVFTNTTDSWLGHGGQALRVRLAEDGIEPASTSNVQIFTSSGTFTAPADIDEVFITMIGGGGGGGSTAGGDSASGGGGGAGGYKLNHRFPVTPGNNYTVTVGSGGAGGVFDDNNGANGGTTSFDSVSVPGGSGGVADNSGNPDGGPGGGTGFDASAAVGTASVNGGGQSFKGGNGAKGATTNGGGGGGSPFGVGANGGSSAAGNNASANTGAGGGGAGAGGGGGGGNGGNGGSGIVIVMY